MKDLIIIAAIGKNGELGLDNNLIWHIPGDLKYFKENTMNKNIIMGYNTFKSLPKLLEGRHHIVITHRNIENKNITIVNSIEELFEYLKTLDDDVYVIGGASIYKMLMPYSNKMLLTHIEESHDADTYFPSINEDDWNREIVKSNEENNIKYKQYVYKRKNYPK